MSKAEAVPPAPPGEGVEVLRRQLERERGARKQAEELLHQKSAELIRRSCELDAEAAERVRAEQAAAAMTAQAEYAQQLYDLNESLRAQVLETQGALQRLREMQDQLVQSEKLASLGALVAGVAHEVNTPIGVSVTAASHLYDETLALAAAVDSGTLTRSQLLKGMDGCRQSAQMVLDNLRRAHELIQSFKQVAVDQSSEEPRRIKLGQYVEEVLTSLRPRLRHTPHRVDVDCDPALELETVPGAISQILTNLVMNSLTHAFTDAAPGAICVRSGRADDRVLLRYSDNGCGIAPEVLPKIFDPFFTTRRGSGGSGLGLHVVYNLVHQTLRGTIRVTSAPGQGTEFVISLPS